MNDDAVLVVIFFFNDTATTEIYTLSLHDALPISHRHGALRAVRRAVAALVVTAVAVVLLARFQTEPPVTRNPKDRKSTRLNSSHANISYAVFCLKKKNKTTHLPIEHIHIFFIYVI